MIDFLVNFLVIGGGWLMFWAIVFAILRGVSR